GKEWCVLGGGACRVGKRNSEFGNLLADRSGHAVLLLRLDRRPCLGRSGGRMQAMPAARRHCMVAGGEQHPYVAAHAGRRGGKIAMTLFGNSMLGTILVTAALIGDLGAQRATALPAGELASHQAIYDLKLAHTRGNSSAVGARGRILYDFSGNSCDGYALQFRQVSELDNGDGKVTLSDLRSTTWEDGAAKKFIFKSQNYLNETLI